MFDTMRRPSSTTATPVSSHEVSIARMRNSVFFEFGAELRESVAHRAVAQALGPHDDRVLVVVAVVTAADPGGVEPVLLVEALRREIRRAHLEREPLRFQIGGEVEEPH